MHCTAVLFGANHMDDMIIVITATTATMILRIFRWQQQESVNRRSYVSELDDASDFFVISPNGVYSIQYP